MPFLETVTLGEVAILLGGLVVLAGLIRKVWPFVRKMVEVVDALDGLPPLVKEMREAADLVSDVREQVATIHHEVTPNGGGSMKDELGRQSRALARVEAQQDLQELSLQGLRVDIEGVRAEQRNAGKRLSDHLDGPRT